MGDDRSLHSRKMRAITSTMTDCLSRTEFSIKPLSKSLTHSLFISLHPSSFPHSIRNLVVFPANDFLLAVTPLCVYVRVLVCVSRGWQHHLSGCCSPCPCPAGGHWVMGEDFLISAPWDTRTLVCNTYCQSQRENKRQRQGEGEFFSVWALKPEQLKVSSDENWMLRDLKNWHIQQQFLYVSACEWQLVECKWAYTKPLDCLLNERWRKGERNGGRGSGWGKSYKKDNVKCIFANLACFKHLDHFINMNLSQMLLNLSN